MDNALILDKTTCQPPWNVSVPLGGSNSDHNHMQIGPFLQMNVLLPSFTRTKRWLYELYGIIWVFYNPTITINPPIPYIYIYIIVVKTPWTSHVTQDHAIPHYLAQNLRSRIWFVKWKPPSPANQTGCETCQRGCVFFVFLDKLSTVNMTSHRFMSYHMICYRKALRKVQTGCRYSISTLGPLKPGSPPLM